MNFPTHQTNYLVNNLLADTRITVVKTNTKSTRHSKTNTFIAMVRTCYSHYDSV